MRPNGRIDIITTSIVCVGNLKAKGRTMHVGVSVVGLLFALIGLLVFVLGIAALVIAIVALARTFTNAREISSLKSGGTAGR